jgi:hypothetical protein
MTFTKGINTLVQQKSLQSRARKRKGPFPRDVGEEDARHVASNRRNDKKQYKHWGGNRISRMFVGTTKRKVIHRTVKCGSLNAHVFSVVRYSCNMSFRSSFCCSCLRNMVLEPV